MIQPASTDAERLALAGFLSGYRGLTREACALDLRQFTTWCRTRSLNLFAVRRADIESFARDLLARVDRPAPAAARAAPGLRGPALAASLLLAGTRLTHAQAAGLVGDVITHWTVTTTLQRLHATPQWSDICTALTALAGHLDTQPAIIDYERRRHLDYTSLLPDPEWEDIRLRTERAGHLQLSGRLAPYARHLLFTQLSGLPFTRAPSPRPRDDHTFKSRLAAFITALTPGLAAELTRVAEEFLACHRIRDEPPVWQPPARLLDGLDLPGPDLARFDPDEVHKLARTDGASAASIARRLGTTSDAIQAPLFDHPAPADPAGAARRRRARYTISREQFWDLHHG
jgi:hypothetical protein